jgi:hypothetical protein
LTRRRPESGSEVGVARGKDLVGDYALRTRRDRECRSNARAGRRRRPGTLCIRRAARTPLVVTSVHAFIWPFSRAARRPCSKRALYAPQTPVNHIDGARSSGFPGPCLTRVAAGPVKTDRADEPLRGRAKRASRSGLSTRTGPRKSMLRPVGNVSFQPHCTESERYGVQSSVCKEPQ